MPIGGMSVPHWRSDCIRHQRTTTVVRLLQSVLVLHAAGAASVLGQTTVHLEQRWATKGSPDIGEFASITGMIEVSPGRVWVADARTSRLIAITEDGQEVRLLARNGEGPGEVDAPLYMARFFSSGEVAVYSRRSIEIFSADGDFARRVWMPVNVTNAKGFTVLPSGEFVISGGIYGNDYGIHRLSSDGRSLVSWDPVPTTRNPRAGVMVAGGAVHAAADGTILFSRAAPHEIVVFSKDGERIEAIASDPDLLSAIADEFIVETVRDGRFVRSFRWFFPQSRAVYRLDGHTLVNIVVFQEQDRSVWEVYRSGRRIASTLFRRAYRPWAITSEGGVLVSYVDPDTGESVAALIEMRLEAADEVH
jgi:outer membrane protein assembly factor BamB